MAHAVASPDRSTRLMWAHAHVSRSRPLTRLRASRRMAAFAMALLLATGCDDRSVHGTGNHLGQPLAGRSPVAAGTVCGTVRDKLNSNLVVQVTVLFGPISCILALHVAASYFNTPPDKLQGSGGFMSIGIWGCASEPGSVYVSTGHGGDCSTKAYSRGTRLYGADISLDKPGTKASPFPTTAP